MIASLKTSSTLIQKIKEFRALNPFIIPPFSSYAFLQVQSNKTILPPKSTLRINDSFRPSSKDYGFSIWNVDQLFPNFSSNLIQKSFIANPYKSQELIKKSLQLGLRKMVVADIDQIKKIQENYTKLLRKKKINGQQVPEFIFRVEDFECDYWTLSKLNSCGLYVSGLIFDKDLTNLFEIKDYISEIQSTMRHPIYEKIIELPFENFKRYKVEKFQFAYDILGYQEMNNFVFISRILGVDKKGNYILPDESYSFVCKNKACCQNPKNLQIYETFQMNDERWAILKPNNMRNINPQKIISLR